MFSNRHLAPDQLAGRLNLFARLHLRGCDVCRQSVVEFDALRQALASLPDLPDGLLMPARFDAWRTMPMPETAPSTSRRLVVRLGSLATAGAGALLLLSTVAMPMASSPGAMNMQEQDTGAPEAPGITSFNDDSSREGAGDLSAPSTDEVKDEQYPIVALGGLLLLMGATGAIWSVRDRSSFIVSDSDK
jgi:hypothetical protein